MMEGNKAQFVVRGNTSHPVTAFHLESDGGFVFLMAHTADGRSGCVLGITPEGELELTDGQCFHMGLALDKHGKIKLFREK